MIFMRKKEKMKKLIKISKWNNFSINNLNNLKLKTPCKKSARRFVILIISVVPTDLPKRVGKGFSFSVYKRADF